MQITTPRLVLRPNGPEYLESTCAYAADPEATRLMVFLPVESRAEALQFLRDAAAEWAKTEPAYYEFAVLQDGEHLGGLTLYMLEGARDEAELGWIIRRDRWRQGIAYESVVAMMEWGRRALGIRRYIAQCDAANVGSYRLMEKLGMRCIDRDGRRKNRSSDEERRELTYEITYDGD